MCTERRSLVLSLGLIWKKQKHFVYIDFIAQASSFSCNKIWIKVINFIDNLIRSAMYQLKGATNAQTNKPVQSCLKIDAMLTLTCPSIHSLCSAHLTIRDCKCRHWITLTSSLEQLNLILAVLCSAHKLHILSWPEDQWQMAARNEFNSYSE